MWPFGPRQLCYYLYRNYITLTHWPHYKKAHQNSSCPSEKQIRNKLIVYEVFYFIVLSFSSLVVIQQLIYSDLTERHYLILHNTLQVNKDFIAFV